MPDLVPLALGLAISPLPVAAVIVLLLSERAGTVGWGFAAGFVAGVAAASTAAVLLSSALPLPSPDGRAAGPAWARIVVGLLLLSLGVRGVWARLRRGPTAAPPWWLTSLDRLTFGRAVALGLLLSAANPKNLPIALAAGVVIATGAPTASWVVTTLVLFVLVATSTVLAPAVVHLVAPGWVARPFGRLRTFLARHGRTFVTVVLLVVGGLVLVQGVSRL